VRAAVVVANKAVRVKSASFRAVFFLTEYIGPTMLTFALVIPLMVADMYSEETEQLMVYFLPDVVVEFSEKG
jgi:hypothetical protein